MFTGDADGLGEVRKGELAQSGLQLGIHSEADITVIDDPWVAPSPFAHLLPNTLGSNCPDSMTTNWDPKLITQLLTSRLVPDKQTPSIDTIITFDAEGVSSHPNHKSLYHGARHFLTSLTPSSQISLYTLTTTSILRKYLSVLDAPFTILNVLLSSREQGDSPSPLLFVSTVTRWRTAQRAMTTAHVSQMRWFRWGWIGMSRYMVVNDLRREVVGLNE
jgi:N-acetylglucosaminylphosphatidylinositol deacetylase